MCLRCSMFDKWDGKILCLLTFMFDWPDLSNNSSRLLKIAYNEIEYFKLSRMSEHAFLIF